MLDNKLMSNTITILATGLAQLFPSSSYITTESGVIITTESSDSLVTGTATSIAIKQSFQPVQQGANSMPTLYLNKVGDYRRGMPYRASVWDAVNNIETYTELQQYETTFQITAWATQDPSNVNSLTASDLANYAAYVMQSDGAIFAYQALGVGIMKIGDVRNPYFSDDRERFEASPSFDFTLTHKQTIILTTPVITETVLQVLDV